MENYCMGMMIGDFRIMWMWDERMKGKRKDCWARALTQCFFIRSFSAALLSYKLLSVGP